MDVRELGTATIIRAISSKMGGYAIPDEDVDFKIKYEKLKGVELKKRKIEKEIDNGRYMLLSQAYREASKGNMRWIPLVVISIIRCKSEGDITNDVILYKMISTIINNASSQDPPDKCPIFEILAKYVAHEIDPHGVNKSIALLFGCDASDPLAMFRACGVCLFTEDAPLLSATQAEILKRDHFTNPLVYVWLESYYLATNNEREEAVAYLNRLRLIMGYNKERLVKIMKSKYPNKSALYEDSLDVVEKCPYICMEWAHDTVEKKRKELKSLLLYIRHFRPDTIFHALPLEIFAIIMDFAGLFPLPRRFV